MELISKLILTQPCFGGLSHFSLDLGTISQAITSIVFWWKETSEVWQSRSMTYCIVPVPWRTGTSQDQWELIHYPCFHNTGPLFTKRTDVLPQDFVKPRSREIRVYTFLIALKFYRQLNGALKFDRRLGSAAAERPVKFQSDPIIKALHLAASRSHDIWRLVNIKILKVFSLTRRTRQ